jgi:hypothetical protein
MWVDENMSFARLFSENCGGCSYNIRDDPKVRKFDLPTSCLQAFNRHPRIQPSALAPGLFGWRSSTAKWGFSFPAPHPSKSRTGHFKVFSRIPHQWKVTSRALGPQDFVHEASEEGAHTQANLKNRENKVNKNCPYGPIEVMINNNYRHY